MGFGRVGEVVRFRGDAMTVIDEAHSYLVRQFHFSPAQPAPPSLSILRRRTEPARLVNAQTGKWLTTHFYDPNVETTPAIPPGPYPGEMVEIHERIVRFRHTDGAPSAPDLGISLKAGWTEEFDPANGRKVTVYRYEPEYTPPTGGEPIVFGDDEMFAFGDGEFIIFGAA